MRLTPEQQSKITTAFKKTMPDTAALYLFGSRVKDHLRGGDIDLLIVLEDQALVAKARSVRADFLLALNQALGEQKFDIKICYRAELATDPFLVQIFDEAVQLK